MVRILKIKELISSYYSMSNNKKLRPFFGRVGSKRTLKEKIYALMPNNFDTYIEPFVGGGAIFLSLEREVPIIINDLDTQLMKSYSILKKGITGDINIYNSKDIIQLQSWMDEMPKNELAELVKFMISSSNTFANKGYGKVYKPTNPYFKLKFSKKYTHKLQNCIIRSGDYRPIMLDYDNENAFFYLDPPYESCRGLYKHEKFDFDGLRDFLRNIKGKFLLSLNYSESNIERFSEFNLTYGGEAGGTMNQDCGVGVKKRGELFIKNY